MRIHELLRRTGLTGRQLRYLIAQGFVPRPYGGRATAEYGEEHLEAIRRYQRLRALGFPPAAIRRLMEARRGVPIPVTEGITLVVDPSLVASGRPVEPIVEQLRRLLRSLLEDPDDVLVTDEPPRSPRTADRA